MKSKKLTIIAFLMFLAAGSQKLQASSEFTFDKHGVKIDSFGNRYHRNADGSDVIKEPAGFLHKIDASGNSLEYHAYDKVGRIGWKVLRVVDEKGNCVGRYGVDPQGFIGHEGDRIGDPVVPIKDPELRKTISELAAKLDAIEVPAHL